MEVTSPNHVGITVAGASDMGGITTAVCSEGLDLRLPYLNISASKTKSSSITDEPLIVGLIGRLKFEAWKDFDTCMHKTLGEVSKLPSKYIENALQVFQICRKEVNVVSGSSEGGTSTPMQDEETTQESSCFAATPRFSVRDPRRYFDTSTSVDVDGLIFIGLRELLTGIHAPNYDFTFPIKQFHLLGIPRTLKPRKPIPDRALCTVDMNRTVVPPVCTFEMKGPTESFSKHVRSCCRRMFEVADSCDDVVATLDRVVSQLCDGHCEHELSSAALCLYFNHIFKGSNDWPHVGEDVTKKISMMIAQTLVQALTTSSGCGFLFTYENGIAFELHRRDDDNKIVVRTSPMFCCGNQKGTLAGLLTMSNYAVKKLSDDKGSMQRVMDFSNEIWQAYETGDSAREAGAPTNENNAGNTSASQRGNVWLVDDAPNSTRTNANDNIDSGVKHSDSGTQVKRFRERTPGTSASETPTETPRSPSCISDVTHDIESEHYEETKCVLYNIYRKRGQILGEGLSGTVFEATWNGKKVALKIWSGEHEEGLFQLCKEVEAFEFMGKSAPSLLGNAVPCVVLTLNTKARGGTEKPIVALATEIVGEEVIRDIRGSLWVGSNNISSSDGVPNERNVCRAALNSLASLHQNYVLHGDIALRNLRVARDKRSEFGWRTWWIDFGKASFGEQFNQSRCATEAYQCATLFENAGDIRAPLHFSPYKKKKIVQGVKLR